MKITFKLKINDDTLSNYTWLNIDILMYVTDSACNSEIIQHKTTK